MSALASFLPLYLSLLLTASVMGGIVFRARYERSPGVLALLYPFTALFVSGMLESLRVLSGSLGAYSIILDKAASGFRIINGLGWFLLCHENLRSYGALGWRKRLNAPVIAVTTACAIAYAAAATLGAGKLERTTLSVGLWLMSSTALYAAFTAILSLRKINRLWPSSLAGVRMAVLAVISYPACLLAERFGYIWPFLDRGRPVFEQMYPWFMAAFAVIVIPALLSREKGSRAEPGDARALETLTERERGVALLLRQGKTHKEIAAELSVSVATVKSHANSVYRKLGISGKQEVPYIAT